MTYVVTEACIGCRYGECAQVCPVDAFHEGPNFMAIDPVACINCALCEMVCPVDAVVSDRDLTDAQREFPALNRDLAAAWPKSLSTTPLPGAEGMAALAGKRALLIVPAPRGLTEHP